jgi:DNA-binding response OmpR family regulator
VSLTTDSVRPARIVVIEDNRADVFLLERALKKQGLPYILIHLIDGTSALDYIHRRGKYANAETPDLILTDLSLAKYSGEDIFREARAEKHLDGVPVCAWSSSQSPQDHSRLTELGVARFITKPAGLDRFMEIGGVIKEILAQPHG